MYAVFRHVIDLLDRFLIAVCCVLLSVMTAVIVMLVFTRNFMGFSYPWSEEITRFLMIWLVFLGAAVLVRRDDHIAFDLLPKALSGARRSVVKLLIRLPILAMLGLLIQQSVIITETRGGITSPALGVPLSWVYAAIPTGAILMALFLLFRIWGDIRILTGREA